MKCLILNKILNISGNQKTKKMTDCILEIAEIGLICNYCFMKKILVKSGYQCRMPQYNSKVKDDFEVINQFTVFLII